MIETAMTIKQLPIFATKNDITLVMAEVSINKNNDLVFVELGLFDQPNIQATNDFENMQPFRTYMIFDKVRAIEVRKVPQRRGGEKYEVMTENLQGIVIHTGGLIDGQRLLAGQISPLGDSTISSEMYKHFVKVIRSRFEKIKSFNVGPEAVKFLDSGMRLTPTAKSPESYDLTRQNNKGA